MMLHAILLVCNDCTQIDIFNALKYVTFDKRTILLQLRNQFLCLQSFRGSRSVLMTGAAGFGKVAGTLQEMKIIIISPFTDIRLTD